MHHHYDIDSFYGELVARGFIVPVGVQGAFGRGPGMEKIIAGFNALLDRETAGQTAEPMFFPPIINRSIIEKVHYLESFPHLCGSVHSFFGSETEARQLAQVARDGGDWGAMLKMTDVVLSPAACYPVYPTLAGTLPVGGRLISVANWVFRHEPSAEPTRMQSFRMRELVRVGSSDEVCEWRDDWLSRALTLLRSLGLRAEFDAASDPFFGRAGKVLGRSQKEQRLKFEILVPVISQEHPTALCSFNFHQDHFGSTFDIRCADGSIASTACLGFGLERVAMALVKEHGFDLGRWPASVRESLSI